MKLHQVKYSGYEEILHRDVSSTETKHEKSKDTKKKEFKPVQAKHEPKIIELGQCQTFSDVKEKCLHQLIDEKKKKNIEFFYFSPFIMNEGTKVDENTLLLCPSDMPKDTTLCHVIITADGNCLPY
ncbi:hypothetical protein ACJMK2_026807 [Sinanodonta woodiana]|uniref:Uncharacterized protein n=1 Tax=Sinanodonta woodiana TaxID=1069815 RepID=A0ABD3XL75_SINWO